MNKLTRIVQIIWLLVAAVCTVEAYNFFNTPDGSKKAWVATGIGLFAIFRYIMLKRGELRNQGKID